VIRLLNELTLLSSVIPAEACPERVRRAGIHALPSLRPDSIRAIARFRFLSKPSPPFWGRGKREGELATGTLLISAIVGFFLLLTSPALSAAPPDLEDRTREIAAELRCVVCQNLSVADSPSEMAQQMRAVVREQLEAGKTPDEVREFFVSKYGEWVLLKPKTTGFSALLWILPYAALIIGVLAALWIAWRWSKLKKPIELSQSAVSSESGGTFLAGAFATPDIEDTSARAELLRERARLKGELEELEFDFESGKLSDSDFQALKRQVESKGALVMKRLAELPAEPAKKPAARKPASPSPGQPVPRENRSRRWQLITGGVFLLVFGIGLGVMLTQSVRPRAGENDSMTGDFMTGTTASSSQARSALAEGKQAFGHKDFPKAIDAFKRVLATEPNNPEAHAYMGFILIQAGHGDGALMAFDKALAVAPSLPMALWGKGMVLYQDKKDYAGAREVFERLLTIVPPGEERNEIAKVLAEMPSGPQTGKAAPPRSRSAAAPASGQISGTLTIDPKLKTGVDPGATLFIIARPAGAAAGPPLAVKKIDKPVFPLSYSLSQENVMMQGTPFSGKISITVRLDKDGNAMTRAAGDLTGDYKKNPVEVGAKNVDIVIDTIAQ
jgi:cytochrome c-type biogenesis protein CcmH